MYIHQFCCLDVQERWEYMYIYTVFELAVPQESELGAVNRWSSLGFYMVYLCAELISVMFISCRLHWKQLLLTYMLLFSAIMYAMCASAEFWRTGGNDTAMCYKYIHRFWSQERVLQESNLTSYTMLFCTCLQHPIWMVTSHFDLSVCFLSCVNQQSSTLRNWPCFSWDSKVVIGWSVRVWGWIFKNCPPHQLLCSSPGPCCLSLSTGSL